MGDRVNDVELILFLKEHRVIVVPTIFKFEATS